MAQPIPLKLPSHMFALNRKLLRKAEAVLLERKDLFWIIGGAGSGKSTIARAISERKGFPVVDMDALIFGDFMSRYRPERHPASIAWFSAENPLQWALGLTWEQWNGLNRAASTEHLDLLADDMPKQNERPWIIDGGVTHPSILAQVLPASHIVCLDAIEEIRIVAWESAAERAQMKASVMALPEPEKMWARFLRFDRLMTQVILDESRQKGIKRFFRDESTSVQQLSNAITDYFDL